MIIYSKNNNLNRSAYGHIETPIKMIIEHQSDLLTKKGGICDWLFNVEKSNKFAETIVGKNEFDVFRATVEGSAAENDMVADSYYKLVEHIQFMKEFAITAEMMEDSVSGIAIDAKRRAESFTRAYYKTIHKICESALVNGTAESFGFSGATVNTTTGDFLPLFNKEHIWGNQYADGANCGTQSNYFWGDIFGTGAAGSRVISTDAFEEALAELSVKIRNMKDENGDALGYTADTLILPGNKPKIESVAKKVCGSAGALGNGYNDINLHYGNWNIVILPSWQPEDNRVMVMSSEANKNLSGNMFFNRVPLTISNWIDHHTGNYYWSGRCRFGVGFGTYKHILLAVDSATEVAEATQL